MKTGFFLKTAWNNIKSNYRFFIPRILCETGLLGVFYIVLTLKTDKRLTEVRGGDYIAIFMSIGVAVMMLLSTVLIFYTNSFLMKQRKREFGLYNVLGMEKKHVIRVLFHETAISSVLSVIGGLVLGMLFYKLCSLLICRLLQADVIFGFSFIQPVSLIGAAVFFFALDLVAYLFNCISISRMKPVEMLASRSAGEKEPKVKWLILLLGIVSLGAGYYISVTTQTPLEALYLFFIAVILVIIGTYFLFTAGSIFVLKALKADKKYYYRKDHMPAVSGLLYRMKQNAVGLASIALLATGVLVMISTTVSLYAGIEQTLARNYPHDMTLEAGYYHESAYEPLSEEELTGLLRENADRFGLEITEISSTRSLEVAYALKNNEFSLKPNSESSFFLNDAVVLTFITDDEYGRLTGEKLGLENGEAALCPITTDIGQIGLTSETVTIDGMPFRARYLSVFPVSSSMNRQVNCYGVVVPTQEVIDILYEDQAAAYTYNSSHYDVRLLVDFADAEKASEHTADLANAFRNYIESSEKFDEASGYHTNFDTVWHARDNYIGMTGALLFLGIILGAVCLFATALIIYYKQISEGYEDRNRYQIMKKVGMSDTEVKKTIRTQTLYVFFLPLLVAGVHMIFAFPLLHKMLTVLMLSSQQLFIICSVITFLVFTLVYVLIYAATAKTYYKIVK